MVAYPCYTISMSSKPSHSIPFTVRQDWRGGYTSLYDEYAYGIADQDIEGTIPLTLHGTLFRNGPGLFDIGKTRILHPFDGDGMVCAISFDQGHAYFRNRFVRTAGFVAEQQAGRPLYRGFFSTNRQGGIANNALDLTIKNVANTNIAYWGDRLLALWEAGLPYRLDPTTLETLAADTLGGLLVERQEFAAHPRIDPCCAHDAGRPHLVTFGVQPGPATVIVVYEFNVQGNLVHRHGYRLLKVSLIHDFTITPEYCVFLLSPLGYNPLPFIMGRRTAGQCFYLQRKPMSVLLAPRHPDGEVHLLEGGKDGVFIFHHANAFANGEEIIVDSVCYSRFPSIPPGKDFREVFFDVVPPGMLCRFTINPRTKKIDRQVLSKHSGEFPTTNPAYQGQPYRYLYLSIGEYEHLHAPLQAVLKYDLFTGSSQVWSAAPRGFVGEVVFVPRVAGAGMASREDDGWLLVVVYDAARHGSDVVILDADNLAAGPVARLRLPHHLPHGLHGGFVPQVFSPVNG
jgi:all-trans-8'-apo-beta-carotenal 15,15'-oxygenase